MSPSFAGRPDHYIKTKNPSPPITGITLHPVSTDSKKRDGTLLRKAWAVRNNTIRHRWLSAVHLNSFPGNHNILSDIGRLTAAPVPEYIL